MLRWFPLKLTATAALSSFLFLFSLVFTSPTFAFSDSNSTPVLSDALELALKSPGTVIDLAPYRDPSKAALDKAGIDAKTRLQVDKSFGRMPLLFERNEGQTSDEVRFLSRGRGYNFYLTPTESVMVLSKVVGEEATATNIRQKNRLASIENPPKVERAVVRMQVVGANEKAEIRGEEKLKSTSNYFIGNDQSKWRQGVANYKRVRYEDVYEGIDLVYYGNQRKLEYDFIVKPGANPNNIELNFEGTDKVSLDDKGNLILKTNVGDVIQHAPIIYQTINGNKETVKGEYILKRENRVAFHITAYNPKHNLVIDPVLGFSTYLGGSGQDAGYGIVVNDIGDIYIAGRTSSIDFDVSNEIELDSPNEDIFVLRLEQNNNIPSLSYSTYLGGSGDDAAQAITADNLGNVYITGETTSNDFDLKNQIENYNGGKDIFILKLELINNLPSLGFSTLLGGSGDETGYAIAINSSGNVYVTGTTSSSDLNLVNPLEGFNGGFDIFVLKLSQTSNVPTVSFFTYQGGSADDHGAGIGLDNAGNIYVAGSTMSLDFEQVNSLEGADGLFDVIVFKLEENANVPSLAYSTYLGGRSHDTGLGLAVDGAGNVYVAGQSSSGNFDIVNEIQGKDPSLGEDLIVFKLEQNGNVPSIGFSTYLGGSRIDLARNIAVDNSGNVYITGWTVSHDFDIANSIAKIALGLFNFNAFASKLEQSANVPSLVDSTYLGGINGSSYARAITVDSSNNIYVVGETESPNFNLKNEIEGDSGDVDVFITKLMESPVRYPNDFDGDTQSDILIERTDGWILLGLVKNSVLGRMDFLRQLTPASDWSINSTGDFNGDRKSDLLLYNSVTGEYRVILVDGTRVLQDTVLFSIDPSIGVEPRGVGDFDGDGEVEIIIYHPSSGFTALVYLTNGTFSSFEAVTVIDEANNWTLQDTGHFNGDNKADLLITNPVSGEASVIEMDGSTPIATTLIFAIDPATGWTAKSTGDFNASGNSDVLLLHSSGALGVLTVKDLIFQTFYIPGGLLPGWELINVGNYDAINKADLSAYDSNTGEFLTIRQNGTNLLPVKIVHDIDPASGSSYHSGKP